MEKSKLGISITLFNSLIYFVAFFGGYTAMIILLGYVFLKEESTILKKESIKCFILTVSFSLLLAVIGLIPDLIEILDDIMQIFGSNFDVQSIGKVVNLVNDGAIFIECILFIVLGINAFIGKKTAIPEIEKIVEKNLTM